jgi:hypothetical protein
MTTSATPTAGPLTTERTTDRRAVRTRPSADPDVNRGRDGLTVAESRCNRIDGEADEEVLAGSTTDER